MSNNRVHLSSYLMLRYSLSMVCHFISFLRYRSHNISQPKNIISAFLPLEVACKDQGRSYQYPTTKSIFDLPLPPSHSSPSRVYRKEHEKSILFDSHG